MHRNRTWLLDPIELRTQRNRILPIEGGDGSTLSLDFTTGVLDPRLTFTRDSNATFINSSGQVQYADANLMARSETLDGSPWGLGGTTNTEEQVTNPVGGSSCRLLTVSSSGGSKSILGNMTIAQGFQYTFRIWVRAGTSSAVSLGYFLSGFQNSTLTKVSGPGAVSGSGIGATYHTVTGLTSSWTLLQLTLASTTTSGVGGWYIYPNTPSNAIGDSIYVWGAQANIGSTANPYYRTTTSAYQAPRFDYDPTTPSPRGLLIEGSASTLNQWSEDYTQSYWNKVNTTISNTSVTCPDGVARTTVRVTDNSTNAAHTIRRGIATAAGSTYTLSWFVKRGSTDTFGVQVYWDGTYNATLLVSSIDNNTQTVTSASGVNAVVTRIAYPTHGWYRYSMTFTHPSATGAATPDINFAPINNLGGYIGTGNHTDFFGIQLELGSGASSYIPTGASTGSRTADICYIPDGDHSWFTSKNNCVLFMQCEIPRTSNFGNLMYLGQWSGGEYSYGHQVYSYAATAVTAQTKINAATNTDQVLFTNQSVPINLKFAMCPNSDAARLARAWNGTASETTGLTPTASRFPAWTQQARFGIGTNAISLGSSTACNIYVRTVKFFPFAMSNAQLQSLTT